MTDTPQHTEIPQEYSDASEAALVDRCRAAKAKLGRRLVILGHHYQRDEVIRFADFTGDSLKLARHAADQHDAEYIVFCGVHFMAETADILTGPHQKVVLPDMAAGCSMADMADIDDLEEAWGVLERYADAPVTPITYINSTAAIKAFVGRHDGAICTSSNAKNVVEWALHGAQPGDPLSTGHKLIFLPDQHLGRNTCYALGWPLDDMVVFDPHIFYGGLTPAQLAAARVYLWKGHCSVHQHFKVEQIAALRNEATPWNVIVHPECEWEVCQQADYVGSTEYILKTVREAPTGTYWAVGTELHLTQRLSAEMRPQGKVVKSLAGFHCLCSTMYRIDLPHLCWALENLCEGRVVNQITVDDETARWSRVALDRMLALRPTQPVSAR